MKTAAEWKAHLLSEINHGRGSITDIAEMLAVRDERIATQHENIVALLPPRPARHHRVGVAGCEVGCPACAATAVRTG